MLHTLLCVDLGGTKALVAKVSGNQIQSKSYFDVDGAASKEQTNQFLCDIIAQVIDDTCQGIVIGVPSMVVMETGEVIETVNIPRWQNVPLKAQLSQVFNLPVLVHNDANCFAMGEFCQGDYSQETTLIGICLGTGLGAGLVLNGALYTGKHAAAGEFGSFSYQNGIVEHFTSGQYFKRQGLNGKHIYQQALDNDAQALQLFEQLGCHLAHAIAQIVLAYDPDVVVLGGSVAQSAPFFLPSVYRHLPDLVNPMVLASLDIRVSELGDDAPLYGSYALLSDYVEKQQLAEVKYG
ncbi:glucokinase [Pseudoalteromonas ulvae UL12]|uniref:Sugar kinase n=1 Tax=Pseudoalteromonas ulvae TaxID=107327 RepID=A0A244CLC0_PSEDV|nr:ROK family protein [Pseudoalteromonas ulvae]MBE0365638.1 glucokinase [Pseudoalteromonas ulvae UL12]OUL56365.1 hypothetical protein B1199_16955 [Pseudoalteromonas ulvae]